MVSVVVYALLSSVLQSLDSTGQKSHQAQIWRHQMKFLGLGKKLTVFLYIIMNAYLNMMLNLNMSAGKYFKNSLSEWLLDNIV